MKELIPIVLFICAFTMILGIRYLINKEKMAMIERGIDPGLSKSTPKPFISLKFGLLLIGTGLGIIVALVVVKTFLQGSNDGEMVSVYFGSIGIFGGLGLVVSYLFEKKWLDEQG
jgi:hypothetical protein